MSHKLLVSGESCFHLAKSLLLADCNNACNVFKIMAMSELNHMLASIQEVRSEDFPHLSEIMQRGQIQTAMHREQSAISNYAINFLLNLYLSTAAPSLVQILLCFD